MNAWGAASSVHDHRLAEVDREPQGIPQTIGGICWQHHVGDTRGHTVDDDGLLTSQRIGATDGRQGQYRHMTAGALQGRAVQRQRGSAGVVEVGADVPGLYGVAEHQLVAARATDIRRLAIDGTGFQQQGRASAALVDHHCAVEVDQDVDLVANFVCAVAKPRRHARDRRVGWRNGDRQRVYVALDTATAAVSLVVAFESDGADAVEAGLRRERQAVQRGIDGRQRTAERHCTVAGAVAEAEGQPCERTKGHQPVAGRQGQLHDVAADIHVGNADQVAIGVVEHQRAVLLHGLGDGEVVDWRIVDRRNHQREVGVDQQCTTTSGVAVIVDRDRHGLDPGRVRRAQEGQSTVADQGIDVGDGTFQCDGVAAIGADGDPAAAGSREGAIAAGHAEHHPDAAGAGVDIAKGDTGQGFGHVLGDIDANRTTDGRRVVHRCHVEGQAARVGADAGGVHAQAKGNAGVGVQRRCVLEAAGCNEVVDCRQATAQRQCRPAAGNGNTATAGGAERAGGHGQGQRATAGVDIIQDDAGDRRRTVLGYRDIAGCADQRCVVDCGEGDAAGHHVGVQAAVVNRDQCRAGTEGWGVGAVAVGDRTQCFLELRLGCGPSGGQGKHACHGIETAGDVAHGGRVGGETQGILTEDVVATQAHGRRADARAIRVSDDDTAVDRYRGRRNIVALGPVHSAAAASKHRCVVYRRYQHTGGIGGAGERTAAAKAADVRVQALQALGFGLVPGAVSDGGGLAMHTIGHETHTIDRAQQQCGGVGCAADIVPAGTGVGAVLPPAVGAGHARDGDTLERAIVHIGDTTEQRADRVAGIAGGGVGQTGQGRVDRGQYWCIVDRCDHQGGLGGACGKCAGAAIARGVGGAAHAVRRRPTNGVVPGAVGEIDVLAVGAVGDVTHLAAGAQQQGTAGRNTAEIGPGHAVSGVLPSATAGGGSDGDAKRRAARVHVIGGRAGEDTGNAHGGARGVFGGRGDHVRATAEGGGVVDRLHGDHTGDIRRGGVIATVSGPTAVAHLGQRHYPRSTTRGAALIMVGNAVDDALRGGGGVIVAEDVEGDCTCT